MNKLLLVLLAVCSAAGCSRNQASVAPHPEVERADRVVTGKAYIVTNSRAVVALPLIDVISLSENDAKLRVAAMESLTARSKMARSKQLLDAKSALRQARAVLDTIGDLPREWQVRYERGDIELDEYLKGDPKVRRLREIVDMFERDVSRLSKPTDLSAIDVLGTMTGARFDSTRTDSEGRFNLKVPRSGKPVIMAIAERMVSARTESYVWLVRVPDGENDEIVIDLNNDNLVGSGSTVSLLK